jgi:hypothetical protein
MKVRQKMAESGGEEPTCWLRHSVMGRFSSISLGVQHYCRHVVVLFVS